ncbi:MAG: hypothetical protein AAF995_01740 [Planctomycetota bacterium]
MLGGLGAVMVAETQILASAAQFWVAGLVAWMWLSERRSSAVRERELSESHARLMRGELELGVLVDALRENTRVLTALEAGQRELVHAIGGLERSGGGRGPVG